MNLSNYADALAKSFLFYEAQRSGQLPANNRVSWRRNSALGDAVARYDANNNGLLEANETLSRDLSGGYYDAGDRMKYAFPLASAMTMLAWGVTQYQTAYSQSGQLGSALASIKWGTDWLLKSHETTGTGANLQTLQLWGQVGRTDVDHNTWSDDQNIAMPRPAYFVNSSKPGSDLASEVAAAFAAASIAFRSTNAIYANLLLDHAKAVFKFAYQYPGLYSDSITDSLYGSNNFNDELAWGAVWLHKAIKATNGNVNEPLSWANNQTYLQIARSKNIGLGDWTQSWGNKEYGTAILIAQQDPNYNRTDIESWLNYWTVPGPNSIPYTSGGLAFLNRWGSLRYAANTAFLAAIYSDTIQDYNDRYSNFVKGQIDYILGNNPRGSSYMVGFGSTYSKNPHHAHAHLNGRPDYNGNNGWNLFNANTPSHNLLSGALVGGPGSINDFDYQDTIQDYIRNEVSLDYNAGLTGALAYLYSLGPSNLPAITLAVSPASVLENGTTNLVYTFTRTGSTTAPLTVNYTIGGTANGNDYSGATPGTGKTITFTAGSPTATLTIDPTADSTVEANETVALTLTSGSGYTIGTTTAVTGTITNDDTPPADNNLYFNVIINDSLNIYSAYHSLITTTLQASGEFWDDYIEGFDVNLDVIVNFNSSIPRATGRSVTSSFVRNNGTYNIFEQGAAAEIRTGVDPNGTAPDIEIEFNPDYLINELWFDSDPLLRTAPVPTNRTDAVTVFMHELGHAFAFNGWMNNTTGTMPGNYQSQFDEKINFINGNFFFSGSQAVEIYGSPVPLTYGNIHHLGNSAPRPGSDLIPDLMNGVVFNRGTRYYISPLDVAIFADTGLPMI